MVADLAMEVMLVATKSWGGERGCSGEAFRQKERGGDWKGGGTRS